MSVMLFVAPRQDALKRGFIPCTEQLVYNISACESGKMSCPLKYLGQDMKCNVEVVLEGFGAWIKGEQERPWSNYLFEPVAEAEIDDELPYVGSVAQDMQDLEAQRKFVEEKLAELEAAKNRQLELKDDVLVTNPEEEKPLETAVEPALKAEKIIEMESGNIEDEVFEEEKWPEDEQNTQAPQLEKDVIQHINQKTAEHLNKEERNDEK